MLYKNHFYINNNRFFVVFFSDGIKIIFPLSWVVPFLDAVVSESLFVSRVGCPFSFVAVNLGTMFSWCDNCLCISTAKQTNIPAY